MRDEGPGFPDELLPHAFEPFSRGDDARAAGGAGLGLAIVDVDRPGAPRDGARVEPDGRGADVWLVLPVGSGLRDAAPLAD